MIALHIGGEFPNILVLGLLQRLLCVLDVDLPGCIGDVGDLRISRLSSVLCKYTAGAKTHGGNGRDEANGHKSSFGRRIASARLSQKLAPTWMRLLPKGSGLSRL